MEIKDVYRFLLKESTCSLQKKKCEHRCTACPLFSNEKDSANYYHFIIDFLKARNPELYFVNEVEELVNIIGGVLSDEH